jgi:hypothetical protein
LAKRNVIDAIEFNFQVWGINSNMEDYRLCWHFNEKLKWEMKRIKDIRFYSPKIKDHMHFNAYKYQQKIDRYTVELLQNKNGGNYLIPEMKNFDFLFIFQGEDDYFDTDGFSKSLTNITGIQSVIPVNVNSLKSRYNLLLRHFNE